MARHDYHQRPDPYFKDGLFYPSSPVPVTGSPDTWDFRDELASSRASIRNAIETTTEISQTDLCVTVKFLGKDMSVVSDPEIIKFLHVENHAHLIHLPFRQRILKPMIRSGLIAAEGQDWKRIRHLLAPIFTPRHIRSFAEGMKQTAEGVLPELLEDGSEIQLTETLMNFTYGVLSKALFSGDIDEYEAIALNDMSKVLNQMGRPDPVDFFNAPNWVPRLTKLKGTGALKRMRRMVSEAISKRHDRLARGEEVQTDFLSLLMMASDDENAPLSVQEIEDQILTFIGAGHETTSHGLTWMFYLLSQDEAARKRAEDEIDALDFDAIEPVKLSEHMPWTMACFEEAMRLFPPAPIISRQLTKDLEFKGYTFKKGSAILLNLWALHRHKKLWENRDGFDPSRFLDNKRQSIDRFQYLPFGLGPHICIGSRFAMQEAAILSALIIKNYQFNYIGDVPPWPKMRITVQAENKMPMRVTRRG